MRYTAYFCEENVWHLAHDRAGLPGARWVVFVLGADGARQAVALCQQRAGGDAPFVVWDYHVVLLERSDPDRGWEVWDQDSTLGAPVEAGEWIDRTFPRELPGLAPRFRVIAAEDYLAQLSSDRRHMRSPDGAELRPFPPWPPILDAERRHLLPRFLDVNDPFIGELCDLAGLRARCAGR